MNILTFIDKTVYQFDDEVFKDFLVVVNEEFNENVKKEHKLESKILFSNFSKIGLSEKLCDYFEMVAINDSNENVIIKVVKNYLKVLDKLVKPIIKSSDKNKGKNRAEIYYDKASNLKYLIEQKQKNKENKDVIVDLRTYTRIMMCLYTSFLRNKNQPITNFDLSISSINVTKLIEEYKKKNIKRLKISDYNFKDKYRIERAVFLVFIIFLHKILNDQVKGEFFDA